MTLCLTSDELAELTGRKQRRKQIEALVYMGIRFRVTPTGAPKVLRADVLVSVDQNDETPLLLEGPTTIITGECVYFYQFIGNGEIEGLVKIGYTGNLSFRRHQIAKELGYRSSWFLLLGTIPGDRSVEARLHEEFAEYREFGEWFEPVPAIKACPLEGWRG